MKLRFVSASPLHQLLVLLVLSALAACGPTPTPAGNTALAPSPTPETPTAVAVQPTATETVPLPSPTLAPATETPTLAPPTATASPLPPAASPTPLPSPTATQPPPPASPTPSPVPSPSVLSFTVVPTTTLSVGDVLHFAWRATGDRAELCPLEGLGPADGLCRAVPLQGSTTWTTEESDMGFLGFVLRAWSGQIDQLAVAYVHLQCQNLRPWFFQNPPAVCPAAAADVSYAAAEHFEHGMMIWVQDTDTFYVFFSQPNQAGQTYFISTTGLQYPPGALSHRTGETPPAGLYEPVSGFGLIWRGEAEWPDAADARQRLGWATEPEFGFDTAYQCETEFGPHLWDCFLQAPDGEVLLLRPDSTAQVHFLWSVWK